MSETTSKTAWPTTDTVEEVTQNVLDVSAAMQRFGWPDYVVFVCMLLLCVAVGLYFGVYRTASSTQEYLIGGRSMRTTPIAMSLVASFISGISLLGIPTEIYTYGIQYVYIVGAIILMAVLTSKIYLPVFHELKITSTYEMTWLPLVIYVPALAFNQVSGVNIHLVTPVVCVICIFYTSLGGIKAVVWTDVIQTVFMFGAIILVIIKGSLDVGGFSMVWNRNWISGRIEPPNLDLNPLSRHTLWSLIIGGTFYWLQSGCIDQSMMQRYLSLPTLATARRALWIFVLGICTITSLCSYTGLLMYATYYKCDPLTTTLAREKDQLLPVLVMDVLGNYPGLPGLFVAGVFSAALSSLSTGLNSMAAVVLEDFYKSFLNRTLSERQSCILMRATVVIFGAICVALVLLVEQLGAVLQATMSLGSIAEAPALALFSMGMLLPWITTKGALVGGISGLIFMSWLCLKAQAALASGDLHFPEKPVDTDGCHYHFTPKPPKQTTSSANLDSFDTHPNASDVTHVDESFMIYRLSYLWYTLVGAFVSMAVALVTSFITKPLDPRDVDPKLLAPFVRQLVPARKYPNQPKTDEIIYAYGAKETANSSATQATVDTVGRNE